MAYRAIPGHQRVRIGRVVLRPGEVPVGKAVAPTVEVLDGSTIAADPSAAGGIPPQDSRAVLQAAWGTFLDCCFTDRPLTPQDVAAAAIIIEFWAWRFGYDTTLEKLKQPNNAETLLVPAAKKLLAHQQYLRGEVSSAMRGVNFDTVQTCVDGLERNEEVLVFLLSIVEAIYAQNSHYQVHLDETARNINDNGLAVEIGRNRTVRRMFEAVTTYLNFNADQAQQSRLDNQKRDEKTTAEADAKWQNAIGQGQGQAQGQGQGHAGPPLNPPAPAGPVTTVGPGLQAPPSTTPGQAKPPKPPRSRRGRTRTSG